MCLGQDVYRGLLAFHRGSYSDGLRIYEILVGVAMQLGNEGAVEHIKALYRGEVGKGR